MRFRRASNAGSFAMARSQGVLRFYNVCLQRERAWGYPTVRPSVRSVRLGAELTLFSFRRARLSHLLSRSNLMSTSTSAIPPAITRQASVGATVRPRGAIQDPVSSNEGTHVLAVRHDASGALFAFQAVFADVPVPAATPRLTSRIRLPNECASTRGEARAFHPGNANRFVREQRASCPRCPAVPASNA